MLRPPLTVHAPDRRRVGALLSLLGGALVVAMWAWAASIDPAPPTDVAPLLQVLGTAALAALVAVTLWRRQGPEAPRRR